MLLILLIGLLLAGSLYWSSQKQIDISKMMKVFDASAINGRLSNVKIKYKMIYFSLEEQDKYYLFSPVTSELNGYKEFYKNANKGDLVIKLSYSDTLTLIKEGKAYQYTFRTLLDD